MNESSRQPVVVSVLNRLLRILCRSLPMYLESAKPWSSGEDRAAIAALARLTADGRLLAQRVAEAILRHGGQPEPGPFPSEFAALNDVGLQFLLRRVVDSLQGDVEVVEHCVDELAVDAEAGALAEEVLGNLQGHVDLLAGVASVG